MKCGNDNKKFEHTWFEGIEACKASGQSFAAEEQQIDSDSSQSNAVTRDGDGHGVVTANSQGYCKLANLCVALSILLIGTQMQM